MIRDERFAGILVRATLHHVCGTAVSADIGLGWRGVARIGSLPR